MKELLTERGLSKRVGMVLRIDREAWGRLVCRLGCVKYFEVKLL